MSEDALSSVLRGLPASRTKDLLDYLRAVSVAVAQAQPGSVVTCVIAIGQAGEVLPGQTYIAPRQYPLRD